MTPMDTTATATAQDATSQAPPAGAVVAGEVAGEVAGDDPEVRRQLIDVRLDGMVPPHLLAPLLEEFSPLSPQGQRRVTTRNVTSWWERHEATGMPAPVPGSRPFQWRVIDVLVWWLEWRPSRAGAPVGNRNAVRHGQYVGLRAQREGRAA